MPRNKKIKNEYRQLVKLRDQYEYNLKYHKEKLETLFIKNKVEHKAIKKEISVMENRYPSLKDSLVTRTIMPTKLPGGTYSGSFKSVTDQYPHGYGTFWYSDGKVYSGGWKNNQYHGEGTCTFSNGAEFIAKYKNNKPVGQVTITYSDGKKWVGQWKDGKENGQGTLTFPNGDKYVGKIKDGKINGKATYTFVDGQKYVGYYKNGKRDGKGTLTYPSGENYVGQWKNNTYNGRGTYTHPDGEKYVGQWKDGKQNGQGTLTLPTGEKYVGEFKDGSENGRGIRTDKKIFFIEEGTFQEGFLIEGSETTYYGKNIEKQIGKWKLSKGVCSEYISGKGEMLYFKTKIDLKNNNYFGYQRGIFSTHGSFTKGEIFNATLIDYSEYKSIKKIIFTGKIRSLKDIESKVTAVVKSGEKFFEIDQKYANGSDEGQFKKYKGEILYDTPHGDGTMIYEHDIIYIGQWNEGQRNGQGTQTRPDGGKYIGQWKDNLPNGQGTETHPDGKIVKGIFKNGKFIK